MLKNFQMVFDLTAISFLRFSASIAPYIVVFKTKFILIVFTWFIRYVSELINSQSVPREQQQKKNICKLDNSIHINSENIKNLGFKTITFRMKLIKILVDFIIYECKVIERNGSHPNR